MSFFNAIIKKKIKGSLVNSLDFQSKFNSISHTDKYGEKYFYARELKNILGYNGFNMFKSAIRKAKFACKTRKRKLLDDLESEYKNESL